MGTPDNKRLQFETHRPRPRPIKHRLELTDDELMTAVLDGLRSQGVKVPDDGKGSLVPPAKRARTQSNWLLEIVETPENSE